MFCVHKINYIPVLDKEDTHFVDIQLNNFSFISLDVLRWDFVISLTSRVFSSVWKEIQNGMMHIDSVWNSISKGGLKDLQIYLGEGEDSDKDLTPATAAVPGRMCFTHTWKPTIPGDTVGIIK